MPQIWSTIIQFDLFFKSSVKIKVKPKMKTNYSIKKLIFRSVSEAVKQLKPLNNSGSKVLSK